MIAEWNLANLQNLHPRPRIYQEIQRSIQEVLEWKHREEVFWKQCFRILWLQEGDRNTKFFHSYATTRKRNNKIHKILRFDGSWAVTDDEITKEAVRYFQDLFQQPLDQNNKGNVDFNVRCLSHDAIDDLSRPYTEEEVTAALQEFHPSKEPGPDGLAAIFYQKFWNEIKAEVIEFCLQVLNEGKSVKEINATNSVLIPKT